MSKFPETVEELEAQGYKRKGESDCRGCGQRIHWWQTPKGKNIPMEPDMAVPHWSVCPNADDFRKKR